MFFKCAERPQPRGWGRSLVFNMGPVAWPSIAQEMSTVKPPTPRTSCLSLYIYSHYLCSCYCCYCHYQFHYCDYIVYVFMYLSMGGWVRELLDINNVLHDSDEPHSCLQSKHVCDSRLARGSCSICCTSVARVEFDTYCRRLASHSYKASK